MTSSTRKSREYALAPDVILVPVQDGSARILDLGGSFYGVPAVGALMLQTTLDQGTEAAVLQVVAQYGVAPDRARTDLTAFLRDLQGRGLIVSPKSLRRLHGHRTGLTYMLVAPVLGCIHRLAWSLTVQAWALLALARLCLCLFGWPRTLAAWQRHYGPVVTKQTDTDQTMTAIDEAVRHRLASEHRLVFGKETLLVVAVTPSKSRLPRAAQAQFRAREPWATSPVGG